MKPTVAVIGILRFPAERLPDVRPHLKALVDATYRHDGCIAYDVAEDPFDPGVVRFAELWPDRASLDRHLQAPHLAPWRKVARENGLVERKFRAYGLGESWEV